MCRLKRNLDVRLSEKLLLTAVEASALSGLSLDALRLEIYKGRIDYVTTGKKGMIMIARKSLEWAIDRMAEKRENLATVQVSREELRKMKGVMKTNE